MDVRDITKTVIELTEDEAHTLQTIMLCVVGNKEFTDGQNDMEQDLVDVLPDGS